ncbi:Y+L amino acid transporter 2-like [Liolophura sinensis]|uniref:Y+L amino acid transporter 2-like n=1 Tax=Liolophura sinensis TaxID=3198878 RepID=UPI0031589850
MSSSRVSSRRGNSGSTDSQPADSSPTDMPAFSAKRRQSKPLIVDDYGDDDDSVLYIPRKVSIVAATSYIAGGIIGAGIFVSPKGVLSGAGSVGLSIILWTACGIFSYTGAIAYAELGLRFPKSGGAYIYLRESMGNLMGFLYLWIELIVRRPLMGAIGCLTFAKYVIQPAFGNCLRIPYASERLVAAATFCILTYLNCLKVKWGSNFQVVTTACKLTALVIIIVAGFINIAEGDVENFTKPFEGTSNNIGDIALGAYAGLYAYSGWDYLNFVTEELKDHRRTLPVAIFLGLTISTVVYLLTNIAYHAVLTPQEILQVDAVAVAFADRELGRIYWTIPVFVAISVIGAQNVGVFTSSRTFYASAREKEFPPCLALLNIKRLTPQPALIFNCMLTLPMFFVSDLQSLIQYYGFIRWGSLGLPVLGLIWLRWKERRMGPMNDTTDTVRYPVFFSIFFVVTCVLVLGVSFYAQPIANLIGLGVCLLGIPLYFFAMNVSKRRGKVKRWSDMLTLFCQKLLNCAFCEEVNFDDLSDGFDIYGVYDAYN